MVFILFLKDVKSVDAVTEFVKKKIKKKEKKKKKKKKNQIQLGPESSGL